MYFFSPMLPPTSLSCCPLLTALYRWLLALAPFTALAIEMVNIQWLLTECNREELTGVNTVRKCMKYILSFWSPEYIHFTLLSILRDNFSVVEEVFTIFFFKSKGRKYVLDHMRLLFLSSIMNRITEVVHLIGVFLLCSLVFSADVIFNMEYITKHMWIWGNWSAWLEWEELWFVRKAPWSKHLSVLGFLLGLLL